jgi:hypothetical protein
VWKKKIGSPEPTIDPGLNEQTRALCQVLRGMIELLDADNETHWRGWMAKALSDLEANKLRGAQHLKGAYGGMGSFNDLIIGQRMEGDRFVWAPNAKSANDQLDALRSQAYGLAKEILNSAR